MPPIEVGPARAISAIEARLARKAGAEALPGANGVAAKRNSEKTSSGLNSTSVETSAALDPGSAPVDADRVKEIRKAVEQGKYPVVPAKIADAIIAAGVLLRSPKQ
ncbi:flagellar biosynthesis anti-sigma factor FlgM [Novosphingobium malaysiense]|uniref:Flagellar biosynthesis anti-sigma factor FlgM n=1 Tax=Novosphingobium malaysiense TaxID=1348853 RepID=A0A0B1ZWB2_9SPHN|nr:flagellar biosynthesis anti-sigma factor FlgM [Novosphingobium malaysiense]KHK93473.1 flagellar biosynthesis anti-sigma factor FlgM [Novosphingobium malaysiense]